MEQKTRVFFVKLIKNSNSIFLFDDEALSARAAATAHRVGTESLCVFFCRVLDSGPSNPGSGAELLFGPWEGLREGPFFYPLAGGRTKLRPWGDIRNCVTGALVIYRSETSHGEGKIFPWGRGLTGAAAGSSPGRRYVV